MYGTSAKAISKLGAERSPFGTGKADQRKKVFWRKIDCCAWFLSRTTRMHTRYLQLWFCNERRTRTPCLFTKKKLSLTISIFLSCENGFNEGYEEWFNSDVRCKRSRWDEEKLMCVMRHPCICSSIPRLVSLSETERSDSCGAGSHSDPFPEFPERGTVAIGPRFPHIFK